MMRKTVITSFTEEGFRVYGKDFLESFKEHWPSDVNLVVYYEGDNIRDDWHFIDEVEYYDEWFERISPFPMFRGDLGDGVYEIQRDAGMVRKVLMQIHASKMYGGKIFWLDADVFTFADIPLDFLDKMLPDDKLSCYLGRDHWKESISGDLWPTYTESGFLGINTEHQLASAFLSAYLTVPMSGMLFTMESWHDCICYDIARVHALKEHRDNFVNISKDLPPTTHPFVNSVLGQYMDHKKGTRKSAKSRAEDLIVERKEDYWAKDDGPVIVTDAASKWG